MGLPKLSFRQRVLPVLAILFGAPVSAEFLQAYLPATGDAPEMLLSLLILAPLYGGAALLIREVAVRWGLGWTGVLLLAAAFGVAMPGLVDLSLFVEHNDDIAYWDELRQGTLVHGLGVAAFPAMSWVAGHVLMSVGAPLAVFHVLAPRHRGRPLLGPVGIVLIGLLSALVALLIRSDTDRQYHPGLASTLVVIAIVVTLGAVAMTRVGRPVKTGDRAPAPTWALVLIGAVGMFSFDVLPPIWVGVAVLALLLVTAAALVRWWSKATAWSGRQIGALTAGALVSRTLIGFLAPVPEGVSLAAKLSQNALMLAAVLGLAWLLLRGNKLPTVDSEPTESGDRAEDATAIG
ncbi:MULTISPECIES: hypothetical protein [Micromonospora]|uniref:Uncharacterized protein n=1 Tax=Micromonospora yangpuensis TaxID=683228 RepID=A0A1C6UIY2_9ACTN|nr:hypothetical protein [Micromonospora yangpuensis]GGM02750.1 hypothetical protein GCM10012279_20450 [Micromonospora yangpuensis]SCL54045.1 hypothetical protein GA0070617_2546 [Micromonospora yangpuensis]